MSYQDSAEFAGWAKASQRKFFEGVYDQVAADIFDVDQPVVLPIDKGTAPWRRFTVSLVDYMVMAQYELPLADEDPSFVGTWTINNRAFGFAAGGGDIDVRVGDVIGVGHPVVTIENLDTGPVQSSLYVKAFDTTEPLVDRFFDLFQKAASTSINGVSAPLPYGGEAGELAQGALDKLVDSLKAPKKVGGRPFLYITPLRNWVRPAGITSWSKYKFLAFVEDDPDDKDQPYFEIYLTLWKLDLESRESMLAAETPRSHSSVPVPVKQTNRAEVEAAAEATEAEGD